MKITLKNTILFSSAVAGALSVGQFFASYQQREAAFAPDWAQAASHQSVAGPSAMAAKVVSNSSTQSVIVGTNSAVPAAPASASAATLGTNAAAIAVRLASAGLKPDFASLYLTVQQKTGTPWQLLAAVHETETGQAGTTTRTSYAGATGPMQFMPATFAHYATDGNNDGVTDIHNLDDAMLTAGRYLAAGGAARGNYATALYHYNHSNTYVNHVLSIARTLGL